MYLRLLDTPVPACHCLVSVQIPLQCLLVPVFVHAGKLLLCNLSTPLHEGECEWYTFLITVITVIG